ncbi:MAG: nicotinate phosphoribosyltransferase [Candidatus Brocadiaceae bacterium]|jgi:nicotinate phosphoribosyltransferase
MPLPQAHRALHTDLYELTMAAAYLERGMTERAAFELFVRELPPNRSFLLFAGLEQAVSYLQNLSFTGEQIDYLRRLEVFEGISGDFFDYLEGFSFSGALHAMPEGTPAFAEEPLLRVEAPLPEAQVVETFLLSMVNYQTLVATKAARVVKAASAGGRERAVVDFGTRRAHGPDAGVLAARASFIGGCAATSNVEAGLQMGIPVSGTEAHSFIMAFESEEEAFRTYYNCFGRHAILLVDTYDSIEGTRRAAQVAPGMRGIRLDSGDLVELSRQARRLLDQADRRDAMVFASGDLDEHRIARILERGAEIDGFGVGTRMVTSEDAPSLGGVYKLAAVQKNGRWQPRLKLSEDKATYPGLKQVHRFSEPGSGMLVRDVIACAEEACPEGAEELLRPVLKEGQLVGELPDLEHIQQHARGEVGRLPEKYRRLQDAEPYPVDISPELRRRFKSLAEEME